MVAKVERRARDSTKVLSASALQTAGSVAAIIGASVAVLLLVAQITRWWWRRHRVRSVKPRIFTSGENLYLGITGLPAATAHVAAFVNDGTETKKLGPDAYRRDIQPEHLFNLRGGDQRLDETVKTYKVEILTVSDRGDSRRVFKKRLKTPLMTLRSISTSTSLVRMKSGRRCPSCERIASERIVHPPRWGRTVTPDPERSGPTAPTAEDARQPISSGDSSSPTSLSGSLFACGEGPPVCLRLGDSIANEVGSS